MLLMRLVVDTNILISAFYTRDELYPKASRFFDDVLRNGTHTLIIPVSVFAEFVCKLANMPPDESWPKVAKPDGTMQTTEEREESWRYMAARRAEVHFANSRPRVEMAPTPENVWGKVYILGSHLGLRAMDALVAVTALDLECDVLTEDKQLRKFPQALGRIQPKTENFGHGNVQHGHNFFFEYEGRSVSCLGIDDVLSPEMRAAAEAEINARPASCRRENSGG